jgi:DNA-binding NarL/FixJ family response regulator
VKRLVIVAENSLIVEAVALGLRQSGEFTVGDYVDGRTATIQEIVEAAPDVVLIDEMEDAERTLELIREVNQGMPEVLVLVLVLSSEPGWLDELFAAGAAGTVSKAIQPAALTTIVRETIKGRVVNLHTSSGATAAVRVPSSIPEGLLSPRELEVLRLVAGGLTNSDIARKLWVAEQTVKFHLSNIYRKLDVANRTEASRYAHVHGLVSGDQAADPSD